MILEAAGSISMGMVVGWLIRYFIRKFETFTPQGFGVLVSTFAGGAIMKYFGGSEVALWCYPIGILFGMIIYSIVAYWIVRGGLTDFHEFFLGPNRSMK